jgi:acetylornithine/N-succinyldiaminopimelate aminotransferase
MPMGAFIADQALMGTLSDNPVLGHITTFGGHPVCCAAGMAALKVLLKEKLVQEVKHREALFLELLKHPAIKVVRSNGLMMAVEFDSYETNKRIIDACIADGVLTDWFLFAPECMRIVPPLNISRKEIKKACAVILKAIG